MLEVLSSNLDFEASYLACWMRVRLSGFVLHPLIPSSEVGGICTRVAQKSFETLNILQSKSTGNECNIFLVADFEYSAGSCSTTKQNIFLHMCKGLSKWHGMVMCVSNNMLVNRISCGREGVSNDHSEAVKIYAVSVLLITALLIIRLHRLQVVRKARRSSDKRIVLAGQQ
jgi:hypothetical protein